MDIYVLNKNLEIVGVVDTYISVIWTSRYYTSGDFELYVSATSDMLALLQTNFYLVRDKDINEDEMQNVMIIKNIDLTTDPEDGNQLAVTGKSISSIVGQRVVASQTVLSGQFKSIVHLLLAENIVYPSLAARGISNFEFENVSGFDDNLDLQVSGDNLEEYFAALFEKYEYGWDVYIKDGKFIFTMYKGADRSYNQSVNPHIVFSNEFDNLLNTDYQYLTEEFKNVAIVAGEGDGASRIKQVVGTATGINRFETWVDAQGVSTNEGNITNADYMAMLTDKGTEALTEYVNNELFDGETDVTTQYVLNRDFFLGDVVQVENDFGISATARILEIIESEDDSGTAVIPTFSAMEI